MISVRRCSIDCLYVTGRFESLLLAYAEECGNDAIGTPQPQVDMYRELVESGRLVVLGAFNDDLLVGFVSIAFSVLPHYGKLVAATESMFVDKAYRSSGAGINLLRAAEDEAKYIGAVALIVSANVGSQLAALLEAKKSYVETNRIFTKCLQ